MQLRMSPGGSICNSSRRRPELPPSSETVTMAESASSQRPPRPWSPTSSFRPESAVDRPVPPPMATSFRPRSRLCCKSFWLLNGETGARSVEPGRAHTLAEIILERRGLSKGVKAKRGLEAAAGEGLRAARSGARGGENYPLELWVVAKCREVCVRLRADSQHGLEFEGASERFERRLDRAEPRARSRQCVEYVRCSGVAFERAREQLLRGDEIASVQLDDAAVVERVWVARQHRLRPQSSVGDVQVGARSRRHLRDARVLLYERAEEIARRGEVAAGELLVGALERLECRRLVARRLPRRGGCRPRRTPLSGCFRCVSFGRLGRRGLAGLWFGRRFLLSGGGLGPSRRASLPDRLFRGLGFRVSLDLL